MQDWGPSPAEVEHINSRQRTHGNILYLHTATNPRLCPANQFLNNCGIRRCTAPFNLVPEHYPTRAAPSPPPRQEPFREHRPS